MKTHTSERDDLYDEIKSLQSDVTAATAELAALPDFRGAKDFYRHPDYLRRSRLCDEVSRSEAQIEALTVRVAALDARAAFHQAGANASSVIEQTAGNLKLLIEKSSRIAGKREQVKAKAIRIQQSADGELVASRCAERAAAADFARAVGEGDEDGQALACEALRAAQSDAGVAIGLANAQASLIEALETEISTLGDELNVVRDEIAKGRAVIAEAMRARYALEWDEAVAGLLEIGARYNAAVKLGGGRTSVFLQTELPRFEPARGKLRGVDILRHSEGVALLELTPEIERLFKEQN